jgi:undecaprenyl diphosphate synthase
MGYKDQIQSDRIPRHVAIIMDGNGRWAKRQGLARMFGHRQGVETVHNITETAAELGISYLTLYAFSTENWNRPKEEVDALMALLVDTIAKETPTLMKNNIRLQTIGDLSRLPQVTHDKFLSCIEQTSGNTGLVLVIALSYSARLEIIHSTQMIAEAVKEGRMLIEDINE